MNIEELHKLAYYILEELHFFEVKECFLSERLMKSLWIEKKLR